MNSKHSNNYLQSALFQPSSLGSEYVLPNFIEVEGPSSIRDFGPNFKHHIVNFSEISTKQLGIPFKNVLFMIFRQFSQPFNCSGNESHISYPTLSIQWEWIIYQGFHKIRMQIDYPIWKLERISIVLWVSLLGNIIRFISVRTGIKATRTYIIRGVTKGATG